MSLNNLNKNENHLMFRSFKISKLLLATMNIQVLSQEYINKNRFQNFSTEFIMKMMTTCSVCNKEMSTDQCVTARLMPCCHTSCVHCIDDQISEFQDKSRTQHSGVILPKCKICSQEYHPNDCIEYNFQSIFLSKSKTNNENSETICQSCEKNKSVIKCETCDWICGECEDVHKKLKMFKEHKLIENTKIKDTVPNNICPEHKELITVYCKTCKIAYCTRCILKDHNLHIYEDSTDVKHVEVFYEHFRKQVNQIKEKRSFTENTLKKFETIESDISDQKIKCNENIKTITDRLHEMISELGKSMLEKVDTVCHKKETEFNAKKSELNQLNNSFKYIEEFMSVIMSLKEPMAIMKAQDLLYAQLEKLLNKPCSHPDFIRPFKIDVTDSLEDNEKGFSVAKMIDGVFKMCFKIKTSDDPENSEIKISNRNIDNDVIELENHNCLQNTNQNSSRGNRESQRQAYNYANYVKLNNYQTHKLNNNLRNDTNRLHNSSMHLQSLNNMTESVIIPVQQMQNNYSPLGNTAIARNNIVPTTVPQIGYGSPQVYRGPAVNQINQNMNTNTNQHNYAQIAFPPNVPIPYNQNQINSITNSIRMQAQQQAIQQIPITSHQTQAQTQVVKAIRQMQHQQQQQQVTQLTPTVTVRQMPTHAVQQTPFNQNIRSLSGSTVTQNPPNLPPSYQILPNPIQPQTDQNTAITQANPILYSLTQAQSKNRTSDPRIANIIPGQQIRANRNPSNEQRTSPNLQRITNNQNVVQNTPNQRTSNNNCARNASTEYELHIPEPSMNRSESTATHDRAINNDNEMRRNMTHTAINSLPRTSAETVAEVLISQVNGSNPVRARSQSSDSGIQTSPQPTPQHNQSLQENQQIIQHTNPRIGAQPEAQNRATAAPLPDPRVEQRKDQQMEPHMDSETEPRNSNSDNPKSVEIIPNDSPASVSTSTSNTVDNNSLTITNKDDNKENKQMPAPKETPSKSTAVEIDLTDDKESTDDELEEEIDDDADCVVCLKAYGEFIGCGSCPRAFHMHCHVPELKGMPDSSFVCTFCKSLPTTQTSGKNRHAINDRRKAICERILISLITHKKSQKLKPPFSEKYSKDFDFYTVKNKLENRKYDDETQFVRDIQQIFHNYNNSNNITVEDAEDFKTIEKFFKKLVKKFMPDFKNMTMNGNSIKDMPSTAKKSRL